MVKGFRREEFTVRRFIRLPEVKGRVGASKPTIYRWMERGTFPRQYLLDDSGHSVAWLLDEVERWIDERIAARAAIASLRVERSKRQTWSTQ